MKKYIPKTSMDSIKSSRVIPPEEWNDFNNRMEWVKKDSHQKLLKSVISSLNIIVK